MTVMVSNGIDLQELERKLQERPDLQRWWIGPGTTLSREDALALIQRLQALEGAMKAIPHLNDLLNKKERQIEQLEAELGAYQGEMARHAKTAARLVRLREAAIAYRADHTELGIPKLHLDAALAALEPK